MKKLKNNLDERQENVLLHIEMKGCWLAFWGLLIAIIVQPILPGFEPRQLAGEWIIFMILALYISVACLRNGIWDRRLLPTFKTNILISLIAGCVVGVFGFIFTFVRVPGRRAGSAAAGVIMMVMTAVLCFAALSVSAYSYKKKLRQMEEEPENE